MRVCFVSCLRKWAVMGSLAPWPEKITVEYVTVTKSPVRLSREISTRREGQVGLLTTVCQNAGKINKVNFPSNITDSVGK